MKPGYPETKRKRIILIYSLAIVLPGILMGIMAYQGIINDQARRNQESRNSLTGIADDYFYALDSMLVADLNSLKDDTPVLDSYSDYLQLAFVHTSNPDIKLLHHHLIFIPDSVGSSILDKENDELLDFLTKIRKYKKLNQYQKALETWQTIEKKFANHLISSKTPVVLVAQLEQIKILAQLNDDPETQQAISQLYHTLLHPPLPYEASQFRFFMNELASINQEDNPALDSIRLLVQNKAEETYFLIRMISEKDPVFLQAKQDPAWPGIYKGLLNRGSLLSIYLAIDRPDNNRIGCIIDIIPFILAKSNIIMDKLDSEGSLSWKITDDTDEIICSEITSEENEYSDFSFSENYPNLILEIKENQLSFFSQLKSKGQGLFILIFVFIAGLMILGLAFTIYTLNHELKLNRLKSDFISNVSHELKSPLTSIRHLTDLLHTNRVKTEDQKKKYYATMLDQTEHLSYLIDNILDFSRLEDERKKYKFDETRLTPFLRNVIDSFVKCQPGSEQYIDFIADPDIPNVWIDQMAMTQVIYNLLDNANKFSSKTPELQIQVGKSDCHPGLDPGSVHFSVKDNGIGIRKKDQSRIFDRFYRSEVTLERGIRGSGIGLTIVKRIVEAHGGRITLESKPGKGSIFTITIPIKQTNDDEKDTAG